MTIEIPNKATNGDVVKALFNVVEIKPHKEFTYSTLSIENKYYLDVTIEHENILSTYLVPKKFWNARYKEKKNDDKT